MDLVAENKVIHVHRTSIASLTANTAILKNGVTLPSHALVFATGWLPNQSPIFAPSQIPTLGLRFPLSAETPSMRSHWEAQARAAEQEIKTRFPMLADIPKHVREYDAAHGYEQTYVPFRLYHGLVPPTLAARNQRDLVILGTLLNTAVPTYAEISSLWSVAYLENLPFSPSTAAELKSLEAMEKEVSFFNAWGWVRFRDRSIVYLDGSVEIQKYLDRLVGDLGLEFLRKKRAQRLKGPQLFGVRGSLKEWFWPYMGRDYRGLLEEYLERWDLRREGEKKES